MGGLGRGPVAPGLAAPRSARDRTPVDRLSAHARSVVVPAVVAVLLVVVTPVALVLSLVVTLQDIDVVGDDTTSTAFGDGASDGFRDLAEAATFDEPVQLVAAGLGGTAIGALAWWLACAHRCLPRRDRSVDPNRAYGPVWVLAIGFVASSFVQGLGLASERDVGGSALVFYLWVGTSLGVSIALVRTLRTSADMIGDITHALAGGHAPTRIMRAALTTILWATAVAMASVILAIGAEEMLAVAGLSSLVALTASLVALVTYGVSVIMTTVAIERSLGEVAAQLDAAEVAVIAGF